MISGENVRLRSVEYRDKELLFKWINNPEIMQFTHNYRPIAEPEQDKWMESLSVEKNHYFFVIELKQNANIIGTCSLHDINWPSRRAELTIKIGEKSEWGKGYAREAMNCLLDFGFSDLNLQRIWLGAFPDNKRAVSLYQSLGFQEEGLMRKHYFVNGEFKDVLIMGKLNAE